jgi:endonuclease YncB( thermonuclease family)
VCYKGNRPHQYQLHPTPDRRGNLAILWRPLAFLSSLALGAGTTLALGAYLSVAHDLHRVVQKPLLFLAFALFWYAAWKYVTPAASVSEVKARSWVATKVVACGAVVLFGLWVVGLFGWPTDTPDDGLTCADCSIVTVSRIIDGDTLVSGSERIRLYGIDAPEVGQRCADGATQRLVELAGSQVRVEAGPRARDVYGRQLAYLYTEGGRSIDELLVAEGHAVAWERDGQHRDFLVALEREAMSEGVGCLW